MRLPAHIALLAFCLSGCASLTGGLFGCPAPLTPVASLGADRTLRALARIERGDEIAHLDLSIEKHADELVVVARNELGAIAFIIVQRGETASVPRSLPRPLLPLPPRALLSDLLPLLDGTATAQDSHRVARCGYTAQITLQGGAAG